MQDRSNVENTNGQQDIVSESANSGVSGNEQSSSGQQNFNPADYVPKARVEELIHTRTREVAQKTAEKTRAEMQAEMKKQSSGMGGMAAFDPNQIRELIGQELRQELQQLRETSEREMHKKRVDDLTNDYIGKLQSGDPELLKRENEIAEMFSLVPYINETSEAAAITKHLLDNDAAYASLMTLSHTSPNRVRSAIKRIEASVKANKEALNREYPNDPLSQPNPSVTTAGDGNDSIEALKRQPWLRT